MNARDILPVALACLVLVGCGGDEKSSSTTSTATPTTEIRTDLPAGASADVQAGATIATESGCLACHKLGENGNDGPGPELNGVADRLSDEAIRSALVDPQAPMPSFKDLGDERLDQLVAYLKTL